MAPLHFAQESSWGFLMERALTMLLTAQLDLRCPLRKNQEFIG
jgi:hypothetical protein